MATITLNEFDGVLPVARHSDADARLAIINGFTGRLFASLEVAASAKTQAVAVTGTVWAVIPDEDFQRILGEILTEDIDLLRRLA